MYTYSIGPLTGQLKPKYRRISQAIGEGYVPSKGVDVYIDLGTLIKSMTGSRKFLNALPFADGVSIERDIISSVLSTFKHWKDFTRQFHSDDVRIFMMYTSMDVHDMPEHEIMKQYMMPYVHKYEDTRYQQLSYYWNEAMKKVTIVMKYIPQGYLIKCDRFDSYVLPQLLTTGERDRIIATGDPFFTTYHYTPNTIIIYSKFGQNGLTQLTDPQMIVQSVSHIDDSIMNTFINNRVFYNTLQAIIGYKDRGILGITALGVSVVATDIIRGLEQKTIPQDPKSIDSVLPIINPSYHSYMKQVYPLIDVELHTKLVPPSLLTEVKTSMVDLLDIDGLSQLSIDGMNLMELL